MSVALSYKVINSFFDRPKVKNACDVQTRRALSRAGAFVRTRARSSMRRRKASAQAGQPPSAHDGGLKKIVFAYEAPRQTVVVGPLAFNMDGGQVPGVLEHGGLLTKTFRLRNGRLSRVARSGQRVRKVLRYRAFPYMGPALDAEAPKFPTLWATIPL